MKTKHLEIDHILVNLKQVATKQVKQITNVA